MKSLKAFSLPAGGKPGIPAVSWVDANRVIHTQRPSPEFGRKDMSFNLRARRPASFPLRRNIEGYYWFSQLRKHVWHESMEEYSALMFLDHVADVVGIAAQPMRIDFGNGLWHFPDFFSEYASGHRELINVRPADLIKPATVRQFAATDAFCAEVGWGHRVITGFTAIERHNLEWLAPYRHPRHAPSPEWKRELEDTTVGSIAFGRLWSLSRKRGPAALAGVYHLLWQRILLFDSTRRFTFSSQIWKVS